MKPKRKAKQQKTSPVITTTDGRRWVYHRESKLIGNSGYFVPACVDCEEEAIGQPFTNQCRTHHEAYRNGPRSATEATNLKKDPDLVRIWERRTKASLSPKGIELSRRFQERASDLAASLAVGGGRLDYLSHLIPIRPKRGKLDQVVADDLPEDKKIEPVWFEYSDPLRLGPVSDWAMMAHMGNWYQRLYYRTRLWLAGRGSGFTAKVKWVSKEELKNEK